MVFENQIATEQLLNHLVAVTATAASPKPGRVRSLHHYNAFFFWYSFKKGNVLEEEMHQLGTHSLREHQHFWFNELHTNTEFCMELLMPLST